jgi:hypothetical protein
VGPRFGKPFRSRRELTLIEQQAMIRFEAFEAWEENRDEVDRLVYMKLWEQNVAKGQHRIIKEDTGNDFYPQTRTLPPMIFGM